MYVCCCGVGMAGGRADVSWVGFALNSNSNLIGVIETFPAFGWTSKSGEMAKRKKRKTNGYGASPEKGGVNSIINKQIY